MKNIVGWIKNKVSGKKIAFKENVHVSDSMEFQLKKYSETYKLLGEYDKKSIKDPSTLAKPGRLQEYTSRFQRTTN